MVYSNALDAVSDQGEFEPAAEAPCHGHVCPVFRFAPSPNGYLHLGHALSALLNFDMARAAGGRFLLRIEDIDAARCRPQYEAGHLRGSRLARPALGAAGAPPERAFRRLPRRARPARAHGPPLSQLREPRRDRTARGRARARRRPGRAIPTARRSIPATRAALAAAERGSACGRASPMRCGSTWRRRWRAPGR